MDWILIERRPGMVLATVQQIYLGPDGTETFNAALAVKFETRQAAESHRRTLKRPYNWVAVSASE